MRKIILFSSPLLLSTITAICQPSTNQEKASAFIFDPMVLQLYSEDIASIYGTMAQYYEAVEKGNADDLLEIFHTDWYMRDTDTPGEAVLNVEDKSAFMDRIRNRPFPDYAAAREFATTGLANGNLAFVRINKMPSRNATSFILFKLNGRWTIMDKVWVHTDPDLGPGSEAHGTIEKLINDYYGALEKANVEVLDGLLHARWDRKEIDNTGKYTVISREVLLGSLSNQAIPNPNQLRSVDIYHDKLAIARIDFPETATTSFLIFFKVNGNWTMAGERTSVGGL